MRRNFDQDYPIIENYVNYCQWVSHNINTEEEMEQGRDYIFYLIEDASREEIENFIEREELEDNEAEEAQSLLQLLEEVMEES